ncbi:MAG: hypothetical protein AAF481_12035 [Acidobacteriota bacterium]
MSPKAASKSRTIDEILADLKGGAPGAAVYLVAGNLVMAQPAAERLAEALAEAAGCAVEVHRRPEKLAVLLDDLRTFSLFAPAKVVLAVDTAVLADRHAVADLLDDAEGVLPVEGDTLNSRERQAASRLLQALRLQRIDPQAGSPEDVLGGLPDEALAGGTAFRKKRNGRGRGKKQIATLREGLAGLLAAARAAELTGWSDAEVAVLQDAVEGGLPENHSLVLAERSVADGHPVVRRLAEAGCLIRVGELEAERRGGGFEGTDLLARELERETGRRIEPPALQELARRTLRQSSGPRGRGSDGGVAPESTARFAAEFRKLAGLVDEGEVIRLPLVQEVIEDRGEQDVWQLLDAIGAGQGAAALGKLQRYFATASDPVAARLSFFALLAGFCRQLVAVRGLMKIHRVPPGERSYPRFKSRFATKLQSELPGGHRNPVAKFHPFRLHRAYLAAGRFDDASIARLSSEVLETELRLKGESDDPDSALGGLVAALASARRSERAPHSAS